MLTMKKVAIFFSYSNSFQLNFRHIRETFTILYYGKKIKKVKAQRIESWVQFPFYYRCKIFRFSIKYILKIK